MPRKGQLHRRSRELGHVRNSAHNKGGIAISGHARFRTRSGNKAELLLAAPTRAKFLALREIDGRVRCGATTRR
jgi:hypothetical protein